METQPITRLLEIEDIEALTGYGYETIGKLIRKGLLKTHGRIRVNGSLRWLVSIEDMWEFIANTKTLSKKISREKFDKFISDLFAD